jgi:hypothetical protein
MYKPISAIAVVLLIVAFGASESKTAGASPTTPVGPEIVAKGKLLNQTAPIPTTAIFTPTQSGLYRLSFYGSITTADPGSISYYYLNIFWTDVSAAPQIYGGIMTSANGTLGWWENGFPPSPVTFQAIAGAPISFSVGQANGPDSAVYALYYTLERIQ